MDVMEEYILKIMKTQNKPMFVCLPKINFAIRRPREDAVLESEIYSKNVMLPSEVRNTINQMLEKGIIKLKIRRKQECSFDFYYPTPQTSQEKTKNLEPMKQVFGVGV